jgi:hypothetical protein
MCLMTRTPMALEIDRRDFTHRVNDDAVGRGPEPAPAHMTALRRTAMGRHYAWIVVLLLLVTATAATGRAEAPPPRGDLQQRRLQPAPRPDFASVRQAADALAATQEGPFSLHQVEVELRSTTLEIERAAFHYFRKTPSGTSPGQAGWEELTVHVSTGLTKPGARSPTSWGGTIGGGRRTGLRDPAPTAVPASILAPEEVIRRLGRGPMAPPTLTEADVRHPKPERWAFLVQLIQVGAGYWAGRPGLHPNMLGWTSRPAEALFAANAPHGQWVWWTLVQHLVVGHRYEFLYLDAVTGTATSHCADEVGQGPQDFDLVAVTCPPPGAPAAGGGTGPGRRR